MSKLLCGSAVWKALCVAAAWLGSVFRVSALHTAFARAWRTSRFRAWSLRRLDAPDAPTRCAGYTRVCTRINGWLSRKKRLKAAWSASLTCRFFAAMARAARASRLLGRVSSGGMIGLILSLLGIYVFLDYLLREVLSVPLLSSLWDEILLLFALFQIVWTRLGAKQPLRARTNPLDLPLFAFFCIGFVLMCLVGSYPSIQLDGYRATVQYLLWFFLITRLLRDERDFSRLYRLLCAAACLIALHGIYQYIVGVPIPASWTTHSEASVRTRVYSIFGSPNIMGDFMVMFVPMTAALAYFTDKKALRALAWGATVLMCFACLFTMSRGAWIGMALAIVLFVLLVDRRLFLLLLAAAAGLMLVPFVRSRIGFLFTDEFAAASSSGGRSERWRVGMALLKSANPWLGCGLGMFGGAIAMQNKVLDWVEYFYLDNYYLKILVEMGYVGLGAFLALLLSLLHTGARALRRLFLTREADSPSLYPLCAGIFSGLCGVLAHCFFENIFEQPYMAVYFWTLAGMLVWAGFGRGKEGAPS